MEEIKLTMEPEQEAPAAPALTLEPEKEKPEVEPVVL